MSQIYPELPDTSKLVGSSAGVFMGSGVPAPG